MRIYNGSITKSYRFGHITFNCTSQRFINYFGQAKIASTAIGSIAKPEAADSIRSAMFVGLAMAEPRIYSLLIAIIMLFANPLVNQLVNLIG